MADKEEKEGGGWFASGGNDLLGNVVSIIPSLTSQYNTGYQTNQLSIAEANARTAEANALNSPIATKRNWIWIAGIVGVVVIMIILMNKKQA